MPKSRNFSFDMNIFKDISTKSAAYRIYEEELYSAALKELEQGYRRDGLWAKALEKSDFNTDKAKAIYIGLRVQSMKDEKTLASLDNEDSRAADRQGASRVIENPAHTQKIYSCNNCDYNGQLLVRKRGIFRVEVLVCPKCGNTDR